MSYDTSFFCFCVCLLSFCIENQLIVLFFSLFCLALFKKFRKPIFLRVSLGRRTRTNNGKKNTDSIEIKASDLTCPTSKYILKRARHILYSHGRDMFDLPLIDGFYIFATSVACSQKKRNQISASSIKGKKSFDQQLINDLSKRIENMFTKELYAHEYKLWQDKEADAENEDGNGDVGEEELSEDENEEEDNVHKDDFEILYTQNEHSPIKASVGVWELRLCCENRAGEGENHRKVGDPLVGTDIVYQHKSQTLELHASAHINEANKNISASEDLHGALQKNQNLLQRIEEQSQNAVRRFPWNRLKLFYTTVCVAVLFVIYHGIWPLLATTDKNTKHGVQLPVKPCETVQVVVMYLGVGLLSGYKNGWRQSQHSSVQKDLRTQADINVKMCFEKIAQEETRLGLHRNIVGQVASFVISLLIAAYPIYTQISFSRSLLAKTELNAWSATLTGDSKNGFELWKNHDFIIAGTCFLGVVGVVDSMFFTMLQLIQSSLKALHSIIPQKFAKFEYIYCFSLLLSICLAGLFGGKDMIGGKNILFYGFILPTFVVPGVILFFWYRNHSINKSSITHYCNKQYYHPNEANQTNKFTAPQKRTRAKSKERENGNNFRSRSSRSNKRLRQRQQEQQEQQEQQQQQQQQQQKQKQKQEQEQEQEQEQQKHDYFSKWIGHGVNFQPTYLNAIAIVGPPVISIFLYISCSMISFDFKCSRFLLHCVCFVLSFTLCRIWLRIMHCNYQYFEEQTQMLEMFTKATDPLKWHSFKREFASKLEVDYKLRETVRRFEPFDLSILKKLVVWGETRDVLAKEWDSPETQLRNTNTYGLTFQTSVLLLMSIFYYIFEISSARYGGDSGDDGTAESEGSTNNSGKTDLAAAFGQISVGLAAQIFLWLLASSIAVVPLLVTRWKLSALQRETITQLEKMQHRIKILSMSKNKKDAENLEKESGENNSDEAQQGQQQQNNSGEAQQTNEDTSNNKPWCESVWGVRLLSTLSSAESAELDAPSDEDQLQIYIDKFNNSDVKPEVFFGFRIEAVLPQISAALTATVLLFGENWLKDQTGGNKLVEFLSKANGNGGE